MKVFASFKALAFLKQIFSVNCNSDSKRIVFHSSEDIMLVITNLQKEVTASKNKTAALESKITASENRIAVLESELRALKASDSSNGVTYVRWGRTTCPANGTEYIYKGYMAGADYTQPGGGSNNLCLPEDPNWSKYVDGYNNGAVIYGTEIELDSHVSNTLFGKQTFNQDIPCAVCRSSRASHVMIPARASCYPGWTQEYSGYVIAAYPSQHKGDYVCLDAGIEFVPHGAANDNDHVVFPVEVQCGGSGSLPCLPFVDGRELACVVCTK